MIINCLAKCCLADCTELMGGSGGRLCFCSLNYKKRMDFCSLNINRQRHGNLPHLNFPPSRLYIPRLPLLLAVGAAQVGEEVVAEDLGELHQRVRVNPLAGENEIDVVAVAA